MMLDYYLPTGIIPYKHQVDAAKTILHNKSAILAFDVGVGKTLAAILVGRKYKELLNGKVVVVAPASLLDNWKRETKNLLDIELFSAGKIPKPDDFGSSRYYLIVDEAHYYQDFSSKRTKAMIALADSADGALLMTATPIRNYPSNLFPLLKMVNHPIGNNYSQYLINYCNNKQSGSSNLISLNRQIGTKIITGSKEDYLELPEFKRHMYPVSLTGAGAIIFDAEISRLRHEYRERINAGIVSSKGWCIVLLNHLRMATSLGKSFSAIKLAANAIKHGNQVAIFTNFTKSAKFISKYLDEYGVSLLMGSVPKSERQVLVDKFQSGNKKLFVMTRAGSAGINLQKGTVFISVDRTWSPFDMIQAEGRIHRNGQEKPCHSVWIQDKVIDPFLDRMMLNKYKTARMAIYGQIDTMDGVGDPGQWAEDLSRFLFGYV